MAPLFVLESGKKTKTKKKLATTLTTNATTTTTTVTTTMTMMMKEHHDNDSDTSMTRSLSFHSLDSADFSSNSSSSSHEQPPIVVTASDLMILEQQPPQPQPTTSSTTILTTRIAIPALAVTDDEHTTTTSTTHAYPTMLQPSSDCFFATKYLGASKETVQVLKLGFGAVGVYTCYLAYGHIQEEIFRYRGSGDGDGHGESFQEVWFLQVMECACNIVVGVIGRKVFGGRPPTTFLPFFLSGTSQVFAKVLTTMSLAAGLSYPVCVLAKSAKVVPVMLGQLLMGGSKFSLRDYLFAGLVVMGTCLLSLGKPQQQKDAPSLSTPAGLFFILLSLVMDGVTGGFQKRLMRETRGKPPTTYDFLLFTNIAMAMVALTISVLLGDFVRGWQFCVRHPLVQQMIMMVCLLSALGQSFIFYVVANFDPMVCATVTTTRKILSVLWSITVKSHAISTQGCLGLTLAITGIVMGMQEKLGEGEEKQQPMMPLPPPPQQLPLLLAPTHKQKEHHHHQHHFLHQRIPELSLCKNNNNNDVC